MRAGTHTPSSPALLPKEKGVLDVMARMYVDRIMELAGGPKDNEVDEGAYMDDEKERRPR